MILGGSYIRESLETTATNKYGISTKEKLSSIFFLLWKLYKKKKLLSELFIYVK